MGDSKTALHEPREKLTEETLEVHRAIMSLMEEFEAVDWYRQRADACGDAQLQAILRHNMNEELEHACMVLEWLRRTIPELDANLRTYLFSTGDVTHVEEQETGKQGREEAPAERPPATVGTLLGGSKKPEGS